MEKIKINDKQRVLTEIVFDKQGESILNVEHPETREQELAVSNYSLSVPFRFDDTKKGWVFADTKGYYWGIGAIFDKNNPARRVYPQITKNLATELTATLLWQALEKEQIATIGEVNVCEPEQLDEKTYQRFTAKGNLYIPVRPMRDYFPK